MLSEGKCWLDASQSAENQACVHSLTHDPVTLSAQLHQFKHVNSLRGRSKCHACKNFTFYVYNVFMENVRSTC